MAALAALAACGHSKDEPKKAAAATVQHALKEEQLATVTLAPEAETRLGVETTPIERRAVGRTRSVGGEVIAPPGQSNVVNAPIAGTLVAPQGSSIPPPGTPVRKGQIVMSLLALPPAGDVAGGEIRRDAAQKAARAEQLLKDGAGSRRALEEAQAELALAEAAVRAARPQAARAGDALPIVSPQDGVMREVRVGVGQAVSSGAVLFQVDSVSPVWVRVPVYVGDLATIARNRPASVSALSAQPGGTAVAASPVTGPRSANPDAATSDLYYELPNASGALRPGQRVAVSLPLQGTEESLVAPWSAVLHDMHGGTWVYENTAPHVYARRRVEVRYVSDGLAVLARGPAPGTKVVSVAAIEIFGTEFGTGK